MAYVNSAEKLKREKRTNNSSIELEGVAEKYRRIKYSPSFTSHALSNCYVIQFTIVLRTSHEPICAGDLYTPKKLKKEFHWSVLTNSYFRQTGYASLCLSVFHIEKIAQP